MMTSPAVRIGLAVAVAGMLSPAGCRADTKETRMDAAVFGKLERVYVGRFSLEVPAGARRYGERYDVRGLSLSETELAPPLEGAWKRAWTARMAEVEALKAERRRPNQLIGEVRGQSELEPGKLAMIVYHHSNARLTATFAALFQVGPRALWLTRVGELKDEAAIRATVGTVARAYEPGVPGHQQSPGAVYHLANGVVRVPFAERERASATFEGGPLGVEVEISTNSVVSPERGGLGERFGEAVARAGAAFAAGASPVRSGSRTVAGMKGEEFVMRDSEEGELYFMWEFPGEAGSGSRPRIQLQMITKDERQKEKMAFWDALLGSLRPAADPVHDD